MKHFSILLLFYVESVVSLLAIEVRLLNIVWKK